MGFRRNKQPLSKLDMRVEFDRRFWQACKNGSESGLDDELFVSVPCDGIDRDAVLATIERLREDVVFNIIDFPGDASCLETYFTYR